MDREEHLKRRKWVGRDKTVKLEVTSKDLGSIKKIPGVLKKIGRSIKRIF